jgi:hypothetical protein
MRISTFHKNQDDNVVFVRGMEKKIRDQIWDRIYISSLFTYDLPKTVKTINFYSNSVKDPELNIIVGGIGATLIPNYIRENSRCKLITGPLDQPNALGYNEDPVSDLIPDYQILSNVDYEYGPGDSYFTRVSIGCIRKCKFCAVPTLEPNFGFLQNIKDQVEEIKSKYGEKKDLVVLDNNILALSNICEVIQEIKDLGFKRNAKFERKLRFVDFNQGIDARLITPNIAKELGKINIRPIRLAFDNMAIEDHYRKAIKLLSDQGYKYFTTYVMYNYQDTPRQFYDRLRINIDLSNKYSIRLTGFPMRFVPIHSVQRHYISKYWNWKFLRGIQCVLNATHGMVSPLEDFFDVAFGKSYDDFLEILTMPDNYIIFRNKYKEQASEWKKYFDTLNQDELTELYRIFDNHHHNVLKVKNSNSKINRLLSFYKDRGLKDLSQL